MRSRARLAPELRENRLPSRLGIAGGVGALACTGVAVVATADPSPLVVLAVGVMLGVAVSLITALGRSGRQHLAAPVADEQPEPEPEASSAPIVHLPRPADEIAVWRAKPRPARRRTYGDPMLATAGDAGVCRGPRHSREDCDTPTGVIPAVTS